MKTTKTGSDSVESLQLLKDVSSQLIYSDRFLTQYGQSSSEATDFWIKLDSSSYLQLSSTWYECQETLLDYPVIVANASTYEFSGPRSIFSFENMNTYSSASLLSIAHEDEPELVYEGAIFIERADGKKIIISGGDSAFRNLILEHDDAKVKAYLSNITASRKIF